MFIQTDVSSGLRTDPCRLRTLDGIIQELELVASVVNNECFKKSHHKILANKRVSNEKTKLLTREHLITNPKPND